MFIYVVSYLIVFVIVWLTCLVCGVVGLLELFVWFRCWFVCLFMLRLFCLIWLVGVVLVLDCFGSCICWLGLWF